MQTANRLPDLVTWIIETGSKQPGLKEFWEMFGVEARAQGLPVDRIWHSSIALHPQLRSSAVIWNSSTLESEIGYFSHERAALLAQQKQVSIIQSVMTQGLTIRRHLSDVDKNVDDGKLIDLQADGYIDYIAFPIGIVDGPMPGALTYATRNPDGFSRHDLTVLEGLLPVLRVVCRGWVENANARNLLDVYLGKEPSERVLSGSGRRPCCLLSSPSCADKKSSFSVSLR